jgi:nucleoside-triphosphatase THEP1
MNQKLSEKWIKASIAGTIWAASEIVLGSFLHNLRIPFSGNILTAIGLIILISIGHIWNERGIFWRAGLICAIMKTMSPSAVIFGPMIAIFAESLLLEISTTLLGRTMAGFALGSMLAMSWNLFQKIFSYIFYYGTDIIAVYTNLIAMARKQLRIETAIVWMPILILLVVYAAFGLFAAFIGIRVGKRMAGQPGSATEINNVRPVNPIPVRKTDDFSYSVAWLAANFVLIISSFFILGKTAWYVWIPGSIVIILIWVLRYRRAMRQLSKPKFWVFFVLLTIITAFVFTKAGEASNFWQQGLLTGLQMNFRAAIIIVGFSALGTELYNPVVRAFFQRTSFRNLPLAIELSVESLPGFIATIPDFKSLVKNPVSIFHEVLSHAEKRFSEIKGENRKVFIVTGERGAGKTTFIKNLTCNLKAMNVRTGGILSERIMTGTETTGYDIVNLESGTKEKFLCAGEPHGIGTIGKFNICEEGLREGRKILHSQLHGRNRLVVIDEVGMLDINDVGWAENIDQLVKKSHNNILLSVRDQFVGKVTEKWSIDNPVIINISEIDAEKAATTIAGILKS